MTPYEDTLRIRELFFVGGGTRENPLREVMEIGPEERDALADALTALRSLLLRHMTATGPVLISQQLGEEALAELGRLVSPSP